MVFLTGRHLDPREFAERHPYQVVTDAGELVSRFSNLSAAFDTAKSLVEDKKYKQLDVIMNGQLLGQYGGRTVFEAEETLP